MHRQDGWMQRQQRKSTEGLTFRPMKLREWAKQNDKECAQGVRAMPEGRIPMRPSVLDLWVFKKNWHTLLGNIRLHSEYNYMYQVSCLWQACRGQWFVQWKKSYLRARQNLMGVRTEVLIHFYNIVLNPTPFQANITCFCLQARRGNWSN